MAVDGAATAPDDLIELGRIISAYGVRGWVKIQPHSAQGTVLRAAPVWWLVAPVAPLAKPGAPVPHKVKQVRPQGSTVVADLEGVGERDLAESLRGYAVLVSRQHWIWWAVRYLAQRACLVWCTRSLITAPTRFSKYTVSKHKRQQSLSPCLMQKVSRKKHSCPLWLLTCSMLILRRVESIPIGP